MVKYIRIAAYILTRSPLTEGNGMESRRSVIKDRLTQAKTSQRQPCVHPPVGVSTKDVNAWSALIYTELKDAQIIRNKTRVRWSIRLREDYFVPVICSPSFIAAVLNTLVRGST